MNPVARITDLAVETTPAVAGPAREAAHGQVVYITDQASALQRSSLHGSLLS
jgi:hypothetical protein